MTSFLSNMFGVFIQFLTIIVTARILGPSGNGIWSLALNVIASSLIVFGLGIPAANVYFIGNNRKNVNSVIGVNFLVTFISAIGALLVYFLDLKYNFSFFKGLEGWSLILIMITIPFTVIKTSLYYVLLSLEEVTNYNKITMIDRTVSFILLFVFIFTFRSAKWIIVSNLIASVIMFLWISYILFKNKGYRILFDFKMFKSMMKYGCKAQLGNAVQYINYRLDVFVTAAYMNTYSLGLYTKASSLGETLWKVSQSVGTVVLPYAANSKDKNVMTEFINKVIRVTFAFILICAIGLTIISKPLILIILSSKFLGSVVPFMLLIPGISIFAVNNIVGNYFSGIGLIEKNIIASAISGVITVILDFTLIPRYGINGAAITSSISYSVCTIISLYFYKRHTGSKLGDILIIKKSDLLEIKAKLYKFKKVKGA